MPVLIRHESFSAERASICVLDTEWRSRLFPCRNSKRPSPEPSLDYGPAAATFAAAFPRRRLRFAFSRFRLRCAFGVSAALPLAGSARFLLLCRFCLRSSSCPPRHWSRALLLWFLEVSFVGYLSESSWETDFSGNEFEIGVLSGARSRLRVTCPSLHGRQLSTVTSS